ncbi:hypothetical protein Acsp03_66790 [Actinomadura sp. NBRC 104412]|uniref:hypothetical protein n=1 Tax=Actinomadura sp. NBRC 104412 TaxID=3032203 RepID=UPI0024A5CCF3|nr:hypothetical protein [Actinomadura sp. NBRC 104412]GLZ09213.1 hypothetical protein Acsp03_66790 [Actinomadura sp. NBRC 104412]
MDDGERTLREFLGVIVLPVACLAGLAFSITEGRDALAARLGHGEHGTFTPTRCEPTSSRWGDETCTWYGTFTPHKGFLMRHGVRLIGGVACVDPAMKKVDSDLNPELSGDPGPEQNPELPDLNGSTENEPPLPDACTYGQDPSVEVIYRGDKAYEAGSNSWWLFLGALFLASALGLIVSVWQTSYRLIRSKRR